MDSGRSEDGLGFAVLQHDQGRSDLQHIEKLSRLGAG